MCRVILASSPSGLVPTTEDAIKDREGILATLLALGPDCRDYDGKHG
jgi:hypothetical protein